MNKMKGMKMREFIEKYMKATSEKEKAWYAKKIAGYPMYKE